MVWAGIYGVGGVGGYLRCGWSVYGVGGRLWRGRGCGGVLLEEVADHGRRSGKQWSIVANHSRRLDVTFLTRAAPAGSDL